MSALEKLNNYSVVHFFLAGALVAGLIHFLKMTDHQDMQSKSESVQQEIDAANAQLKTAQSLAQEKPKYEKEIEEVKTFLETAKELIPQNHNQREVIDTINKAAKESRVNLPYMRPGSSVSGGGSNYDIIGYEVELDGTYSQITSFLYELTKSKLILHVKNMDFAKKDKTDGKARLGTRTVIMAFKYKSPEAKK